MPYTVHTMRAMRRWLFAAGAALAMVSQAAVTLTALADGRDERSAASHVERDGTSAHYAHNDATCVICQARSLTGLAERSPEDARSRVAPRTPPGRGASRVASSGSPHPKHPRAPPVPADG